MQGSANKLEARLRKHQAGFTLMELLVVVGIIVALAAVIIPTVAKFGDRGEKGAMAAEKQNVQAAMDAMMADQNITSVDSLEAPDSSINDWGSYPTGPDTEFLVGFMREQKTKFYYCWDDSGKVTAQHETAAPCP